MSALCSASEANGTPCQGKARLGADGGERGHDVAYLSGIIISSGKSGPGAVAAAAAAADGILGSTRRGPPRHAVRRGGWLVARSLGPGQAWAAALVRDAAARPRHARDRRITPFRLHVQPPDIAAHCAASGRRVSATQHSAGMRPARGGRRPGERARCVARRNRGGVGNVSFAPSKADLARFVFYVRGSEQ